MSSTTHIPSEGLPPPKTHVGAWAWLRSRLFSSPLNILITVLLAWFLLMSVPALVEWAFIKANFTAANAQECRASVGGACWAFIIEKHRLILFGTYPYDEQWRPLIATIILVAVIVCSGIRRFWNWKLAIIWTVGLTAVAILMWGGVLGLTYVENARWGGLPLTLILSTFGIAFAFPIGVLLALGRRSKMPAIKALCVVYIELIRGVPLISLLFMSSVMLPLFLPEGFSIDKLLRAQIAIIMFAAAYIAETVRGGLQAIPKGQYEGADSLGLNYWQQMRKIILPQALIVALRPYGNEIILMIKGSAIIAIITVYDLMGETRRAYSRTFDFQTYLWAALIYLSMVETLRNGVDWIERRITRHLKR